jgi:hypothetical protein
MRPEQAAKRIAQSRMEEITAEEYARLKEVGYAGLGADGVPRILKNCNASGTCLVPVKIT